MRGTKPAPPRIGSARKTQICGKAGVWNNRPRQILVQMEAGPGPWGSGPAFIPDGIGPPVSYLAGDCLVAKMMFRAASRMALTAGCLIFRSPEIA
jgi:hypothetical protein